VRILHTCLNVLDLERSIAFYTNHIGLSLESRREVKQNNAEIAFLKDPSGTALELTQWRDKKMLTEGDNFDHVAFAVQDINSTINELKKEGVKIAMEPFSLQGSTSKIAFIKDPDGNWLELIQANE
jgi:lactoylglutathione lyase